MGETFEIIKATYGIGQEKDMDVLHLLSRNNRICKSTDLHQLLGRDPYPNCRKRVEVLFKSDQHSTETVHEECFKIKEGGRKIGFDRERAFHIDIPDMYEYIVTDASFSITKIVVRSSSSSPGQEVEIDKDRWKHIVKSSHGNHRVMSSISVEQLTPTGDPFPGAKKVFHISYHQSASYCVRVYEVGGRLLKDVVVVEIPKHTCTMLYHLFPKFQHPLMDVHERYVRKCNVIFDNLIVSIAHDRLGSKYDQNQFLKIVGKECGTEIEFLDTLNNRHRGESVSFMSLLNKVEDVNDNHIVFYAHSKGLGHADVKSISSIRHWVELMYVQCLMNLDTMIYTKANCGGSFRKDCMINGHINPRWHYSGSFFFVKSSLLYKKQYIQRYGNDYFISERCPGLLCPNGEGCLVFLELKRQADNLYLAKDINAYRSYLPSSGM